VASLQTNIQISSDKQISTQSNQIITDILRSEIQGSLNSIIQDKFGRTLTASELDNGIDELLKIYSQNEESTNEHSEISASHSQNTQNDVELKSILNILGLHSQQILEHVHQQLQKKLNKKIEKQELKNILLALQHESNDEENDDEEEEADDEDEPEEYVGMTEEEFSLEIAEAFENIRRLGRIDGQRIARFVRDTFCEINGREPELREIADVFTRIKDKLAEEAKEDEEILSSTHNIIIKDDITNVDENVDNTQSTNAPVTDNEQNDIIKKLGLINIDVNTATKEEKEELLKFARNIVKEDLELQAKNQLSKLIGREPTKQEMNDMLVQLATTSLLDCSFDSSDDASDYNPDTVEEKQQLLYDIQETTAFDEDNNTKEPEEPNLFDKPVLTTPVKNKGTSSRVDYYFEKYNDDSSQLYINKAVTSFKKSHNREPSNEEIDKIKHFLHTEEADVLNDQVDINENNKDSTSFKLNFGAEDTEC